MKKGTFIFFLILLELPHIALSSLVRKNGATVKRVAAFSVLHFFVVSTITYRGRICTQCRPKALYLIGMDSFFFFFFENFFTIPFRERSNVRSWKLQEKWSRRA